MDHVHLQDHVIVHEIRQGILVGNDSANLGSGQKHIFRLFLPEECLHRILAAKIQLLVGAGDDIGIALPLQFPDNGGADHAPVARHIDFRVFLHHFAAASFMAFSCLASARSCLAIISTSWA